MQPILSGPFRRLFRAASPTGEFAAFLSDIAVFAGWRLAGVAVLAVLAAVAEGAGLLLLVPLLSMTGIGSGIGSGAEDGGRFRLASLGLEGVLILYVLLVAAAALVVAVRGDAVNRLRLGYVDHLRRRLHAAFCAMEWRAFSRMAGSEVVNAATGEAQRAAGGLEFLLRLAGWAVEIPVLLAVALRLSPAMTVVALLLGGLCLMLLRPLNRHAHRLGRQAVAGMRALHRDLSEDLAGMRVIRAIGLEEERARLFERRMHDVRVGMVEFQRRSGLARAAMQSLAAAAAAVAVWGAVRVLEMDLAGTLVLMAAFARLLAAALRIQVAWHTVLNALPAHAAVLALLARCQAGVKPAENEAGVEPAENGVGVKPAENGAGIEPAENGIPGRGASTVLPAPAGIGRTSLVEGIRLDGIGVRYSPAGPWALSGIDAVVPARAVTAMVGRSGAGKSTLADLLLGLLEPDEGRLLVDGLALDGAGRRDWRRRVGYVPQDCFLFRDTIRANLAIAGGGRPPSAGPGGKVAEREDRLWAALEQADAADFVRALPDGLDTMVGDRGALLSGGQRQRLALARALLPEPDLLVLDEATSALDHESERRILRVLEDLKARIAIVSIAHRSATLRSADHVLVLEAGRLAAAGPWPMVASIVASMAGSGAWAGAGDGAGDATPAGRPGP